MEKWIMIGLAACAFGIGGCATPGDDLGKAGSGNKVAGKEEPFYLTGSRIPEKPPRDRMLRRIEGETWAQEDKSSIISHQDRPGN